MKKCANLFCRNPEIQEKIFKKAKSLKFMVMASQIRKIDTIGDDQYVLLFCQGTQVDLKNLGLDTCYHQYEKTKSQIEKYNEGGPFGVSLVSLVEILKRL